MKKGILILLVFALIIAIGKYFWPFTSYLLGIDIELASKSLCFIFALVGILIVVSSLLRKKDNKIVGIYFIIIACALGVSYFINIERFDVTPQYYRGDYMAFSDPSKKWINQHGLINKYGQEIIAPHYATLLKAFDKKNNRDVIIGIQYYRYSKSEVDSIITARELDSKEVDNRCQVKEVKLTIFSLNGERNDVRVINEMCCKDMEEYINKHIGEIINLYLDLWWCPEEDFLCIKKEHDEDNLKSDAKSDTEFSENSTAEDKGNTNSSNNYTTPKQQVWKERWIPCTSCDPNRKGFCNNCHGEGGYYIGNIFNVCGICGGTRACPICGGRGEIKENYSTWE